MEVRSLSRAPSQRSLVLFALLLLEIGVGRVQAATYVVGGGGGACQFTTIQAALDVADANPGADLIRIAASADADGVWRQQAIRIDSQAVTLEGGYAKCSSTAPTTITTLDGAGGSVDSVITIDGPGNDVSLVGLRIIGGDEAADAFGGGVGGSGGTLRLSELEISNNRAGYGGGVYFSDGNLIVGPNVRILANTATHAGGGIMVNAAGLRADADGIYIGFNRVTSGDGGGIAVRASNADLGSPGGLGLPMLHANQASHGGGLAIYTSSLGTGPSRVRLYSTDATRPTRISGNIASATGGGVYLLPSSDVSLQSATATLCASDFRIDDNVAIEGSAIYADSDYSIANDLRATQAHLNPVDNCEGVSARPPNAVSCIGAAGCNLIDNNLSDEGAVVLLQNGGALTARNVSFRDNVGGRLVRAFGDIDSAIGRRTTVTLDGCLIVGNTLTQELLRLHDGDLRVSLSQCTIAGNVVGGVALAVFDSGGDARFGLQRSVLSQPGIPVLAGSPSSVNAADLVSHELASLPGAVRSLQAPPRFFDPEAGDYRLQAASAAVDFAADAASSDLIGVTRPRDLPVVPDAFGRVDLGAYERQDVGNLVRNPDFSGGGSTAEEQFRLWSILNPSYVEWEPAGANAGSGAVLVNYEPGIDPVPRGAVAYPGLGQCVHLPGPAQYALAGWSRVPGTALLRDYARLHWIFRSNDASCTGPATSQGTHYLARSSTWSTNPPTLIGIGPESWTSNSTIEIVMEVLDGDSSATNVVNAYFDRISLTVVGLDVPELFRDGFEN